MTTMDWPVLTESRVSLLKALGGKFDNECTTCHERTLQTCKKCSEDTCALCLDMPQHTDRFHAAD